MAEPRILFVDHSPELGGAELYLADLAPHFNGCSVFVFEGGPFEQELIRRGVDVHVASAGQEILEVSASSKLLKGLSAIPAIRRIATEVAHHAEPYDVIFANSQKAAVVCALAGRKAGKPVVWNLHDVVTSDHFSKANRIVCRVVGTRHVDHVVFNSRATEEAYLEIGGRPAGSSIVYNGIDADVFARVDQQGADRVRSRLGLEGKPVVGLFSRISPWKGQHILLEAMLELPDVHVVLVGAALFDADKAYEEGIHNFVKDNGLGERVTFLGFRDDIPVLMKMVDVVVHTSTSPEPFGRVIVEGMIARTPVVASAAGGALEILTDGQTGWLVTPGDPAALAQAIRNSLDLAITTGEMLDRAHRHAMDRFSSTSMVRSLSQVFKKVLE